MGFFEDAGRSGSIRAVTGDIANLALKMRQQETQKEQFQQGLDFEQEKFQHRKAVDSIALDEAQRLKAQREAPVPREAIEMSLGPNMLQLFDTQAKAQGIAKTNPSGGVYYESGAMSDMVMGAMKNPILSKSLAAAQTADAKVKVEQLQQAIAQEQNPKKQAELQQQLPMAMRGYQQAMAMEVGAVKQWEEQLDQIGKLAEEDKITPESYEKFLKSMNVDDLEFQEKSKPATTAMGAFLRNNPDATNEEIATFSQSLKKQTEPEGPVSLSLNQGTRNLSLRYFAQDSKGNIIVTKEGAGFHRLAQDKLAELTEGATTIPLKLINESEYYSRTIERGFWAELDRAKTKAEKEQVKKEFQRQFGFTPRVRP